MSPRNLPRLDNPITMRMPHDLRMALKREAKRQHRHFSPFMVVILTEWAKRHGLLRKPKPEVEQQIEQLPEQPPIEQQEAPNDQASAGGNE